MIKRIPVYPIIDHYLERFMHAGSIWENRERFLELLQSFTRTNVPTFLEGVGNVAQNADMICKPASSLIEDGLRLIAKDKNGDVYMEVLYRHSEDYLREIEKAFEDNIHWPAFHLSLEGYPAFIVRNGTVIKVDGHQHYYTEMKNPDRVMPYPDSPAVSGFGYTEKTYETQRFSVSMQTSDLTEAFAMVLTKRFASEMWKAIQDGRAWKLKP